MVEHSLRETQVRSLYCDFSFYFFASQTYGIMRRGARHEGAWTIHACPKCGFRWAVFPRLFFFRREIYTPYNENNHLKGVLLC